MSSVPTAAEECPSPALEEVYQDLVQRHAARVWRMAFRLTGDHADAEDLTQETYYEAWRSIASLREPAAGGGWMIRILIHRASRRLRRIRTSPAAERLQEETLEAPRDDLLALGGPDMDIQAALDALDPDRRMAFLLVFLEGLTCREAGELLDIPLGTVLSRIHRARAELRRTLRHRNPAGTRGTTDDEGQSREGQSREGQSGAGGAS